MNKSKKLYELIEQNNVKSLNSLITNKDLANLQYRDETMLIHAVRNGNDQIVRLLIDKGAELDPNALIVAVMNNNYVIVKTLLEAGMDPYHADSLGETVFDYFNYFNIDPKIKHLLSQV